MSNASLLDTYPVAAASSRRRRLLAVRSANDFGTVSPLDTTRPFDTESLSPVFGSAGESGSLAELDDAAGNITSRSSECQTAAGDGRPDETALDRIRRLVDDPAPRTWLFAGDRLGFGSKHARRGWIEHFSDVIRSHLARSLDVVLDTTTDEARCDRLLRNIDWRLLRFQPDVVILIPGPGEVSQLGFDAARLQHALATLVERLREEGCEIVLCTLPPLRTTSDELASRLDTLAGFVRSVAETSRSVLVDHARHWNDTTADNAKRSDCSSTAGTDAAGGATAGSGTAGSRLLDRTGTRPTQQGHQQLARNLIRALELPLE